MMCFQRHCDAHSPYKVARQDGRWRMVGCEPRSGLALTVVADQFIRDVGRSDRMRAATSAFGGYCCKSRKSINPKNLAKVDHWTFLPLRRFSTPLRRCVIDFGWDDMVPHLAARKTHQ